MKVYVTQGHEEGIGLEVFFKTTLFLSLSDLNHLTLIAYKESVSKSLDSLGMPYSLTESELIFCGQKIPTLWLNEVDHSQSFTALKAGMKLAESGGILYTLPTSKNQFPGFAGHTEYFRHHYQNQSLGMFFSSLKMQVLLLSDHVPVSKLSTLLTKEIILERLLTAYKSLKRWHWSFNRFIVAGLNPHAGEEGLIGDEDTRVAEAIQLFSREEKISIVGPLSADTMLLQRQSDQDVLVYLFHDQGLGVFKSLQGFIGSNITLGLPYPRFSPDHGTSFSLFGKNSADYRGCGFSLNEALRLLKRLSHGQDSSH